MNARAPTSGDVARRAGVSQSAVSRAFTPGASVAPETRARVMRAAEALGYRPNRLARSLSTRRSRLIGVVVGYLDNQFYPVALEKLSRALQGRGYHALVFMASEAELDLDAVLAEILDHQVDGIVMASVTMSAKIVARCDVAGVPVVMFNRAQDDPRFSAVTSDNRAGGREVARFLAAGGHRRIAFIAGLEGASTNRDREGGFLDGLAAAGRSLCARAKGEFDREAAREATLTLFGGGDRPDALFVANDHMAFAALDALRFELGLRVPGDVSVVGYDDAPIAAWPAYDLTTVRQPANRMVEATVRLLLARIEERDAAPERVAVAGPLIVRGTARVPAGWPA